VFRAIPLTAKPQIAAALDLGQRRLHCAVRQDVLGHADNPRRRRGRNQEVGRVEAGEDNNRDDLSIDASLVR
jgi:hypothetical protein